MDRNITTVSYIGNPEDNSAMFITKKVEHLLVKLESVANCLVFCEDSVEVPKGLLERHRFKMSSNPQLDYAKFVEALAKRLEQKKMQKKYNLTDGGFYIGENVKIGKNPIIEPFCLIDHDVVIGDNARIFSGAKIRNAIIGDNLIAHENAVIGSYGFTMASDESGNRVRIPTLGRVVIGHNVEVGMLANIAVGSAGNTCIADHVKIDAFVHIGHDAKLERNVEIPAGAIIGGFDTIEKNVFIGINATLRNRITVGENSVVGMGSVVTKDVPANTTVVGNPAKPLVKK